MRSYLRYRVAGGTYFLTLVTHQRRPILCSPLAREVLRQAIDRVRMRRPFDLLAIVLLPDHLHTIWQLPPGDADYSGRVSWMKSLFTRGWLARGGGEGGLNGSRRHKRERAIWQRRFYEHTVRDENDLERCVDYLHWNPVKHEFVSRVSDHAWSSFHRYVRLGHYEANWGGTNPVADWEYPE